MNHVLNFTSIDDSRSSPLCPITPAQLYSHGVIMLNSCDDFLQRVTKKWKSHDLHMQLVQHLCCRQKITLSKAFSALKTKHATLNTFIRKS